MLKRSVWTASACALVTLTAWAPAGAIPVTDAGAIAQLVSQISYWKQQIEGMTNQLNQLKSHYEAVTGSRGMERLLSGTVRNYLPSDWRSLVDTLDGLHGTYTALATQLNSTMQTNAVLTPEQLARLSSQERQYLESTRKSVALMQVTSKQALESSSQRFASLQQLIDAIPSATDEKAVLDLQARIAVEQAMLQNEQTKLQMLNHTLQAEERAREQRARELAIANIGSLRNRPPIGLSD